LLLIDYEELGYTHDEFWNKLVEAKVMPDDMDSFYIGDESKKYLEIRMNLGCPRTSTLH